MILRVETSTEKALEIRIMSGRGIVSEDLRTLHLHPHGIGIGTGTETGLATGKKGTEKGFGRRIIQGRGIGRGTKTVTTTTCMAKTPLAVVVTVSSRIPRGRSTGSILTSVPWGSWVS